MAKSRKGSSRRWLAQHRSDPYVQAARRQGYRSRASFKLVEMDRRYRVFRPGQVVVDLGAAPGGWCQVAAERIGDSGRILACDLLPMEPLPGVEFLQGDFTEPEVLAELRQALGSRLADVVISDMAPNISGIKAVDQPRAMYLVELALDFAGRVLKTDGACLCKVFQGEGYDQLYRCVKQDFVRVSTKKPEASRSRSTEMYWLAQGFRGIDGRVQS